MQETNAESSEASFTQIVNGAVFVIGIFDLFTARKRSFGKVMFLHLSVILFTWGVCVRGGGVSVQRVVSVQGVSVQGGGGFCPGGSFVRGSLSGGGLCQGDTPYSKERAVRILLKCILV